MTIFSRILLLAAMAAWAAPASAEPQATIRLASGQTATIVSGPDGLSSSRGPDAAFPPYEAAVGRQFSGGMYDDATGQKVATVGGDELPEAAPIARNSVRMHFARIDGGKQAMLVVQNGYDQGFVYRAKVRFEGAWRTADVCLVIPGRYAFEHWPVAVDEVELSEFRFEPWQEGDSPHCE
jgi:hypothetical protein